MIASGFVANSENTPQIKISEQWLKSDVWYTTSKKRTRKKKERKEKKRKKEKKGVEVSRGKIDNNSKRINKLQED